MVISLGAFKGKFSRRIRFAIVLITLLAILVGSIVILHLSAAESPDTSKPDDLRFGHYKDQNLHSKTGRTLNHPGFP